MFAGVAGLSGTVLKDWEAEPNDTSSVTISNGYKIISLQGSYFSLQMSAPERNILDDIWIIHGQCDMYELNMLDQWIFTVGLKITKQKTGL